ncbi:NADH-dependent flavin oxidoreductase [Apilactobacillus ozensis]|uniref:NADH-dependent flavin oxidoreductase n=1 Tax=Apilactobacillus ozensis TaxID=866801 RepID=UPI00200A0871|nr:NADH-dependent flavin oxidoreductase [Apilactobacillus ozensis]
MNKKYERMFESFEFKNGIQVDNRLVMAPMTTWSSNSDYTVSKEEIKYYEKRAKGPGLIITGCTPVMPNGIGFTNEFAAYDDKFIPSLKKLSKAAKSGGAKAILQIFHAGNKAIPQVVGKENVVSASNVPTGKTSFADSLVPKQLNNDDILKIIKAFGDTTRRAIQAGFDGIELHGAHGFLIQNFLSPYYNRRDDNWGGSLENRMKFALCIVDEVKSVIDEYADGPFILGYRVSPEESVNGGLRIDDTYGLIDALINKKVDYIHASLSNALTSKPVDTKNSSETYLSLINKHINNKVPFIAAGALTNPRLVEDALKNGLDFAAVGHGLIINPDWMYNISNNNEEKIQSSIKLSELDQLKLPDKLWKTIKNSGKWFDIVN